MNRRSFFKWVLGLIGAAVPIHKIAASVPKTSLSNNKTFLYQISDSTDIYGNHVTRRRSGIAFVKEGADKNDIYKVWPVLENGFVREWVALTSKKAPTGWQAWEWTIVDVEKF